MNFKNELERRCFEIAERALGGRVKVEHNKTIKIESALLPEVAGFKGPPAKEIDVIAAELRDTPKIVLLVSCKLFSKKAEPAHVQEWAAVVQTMNRYSSGTRYLGLVISPTGFTGGCETWATSHNIGLVPPLKGRKLAFDQETVFRMFERVLKALGTRVQLHYEDLMTAPSFFDFVFRLIADFEGHQEGQTDGRYLVLPHGWPSSFGEMYAAVAGRAIENIGVASSGTVVFLSGDMVLQFGGDEIRFGASSGISPVRHDAALQCYKNIEGESCSLDFVRSIAAGKRITSAADFRTHLELGLDQRFNLGLLDAGFHIVSTEVPVNEHLL